MKKKIDWRYHRQNCDTCGKSEIYLANHDFTVREELDARKNRIDAAAALEMLNQADRLCVAKGKGVVELSLKKDRPDDETLVKLVMGPTGNLRAPTLRIGKTLLVGFNQEMYEKHL